jgi:hypothetical protein
MGENKYERREKTYIIGGGKMFEKKTCKELAQMVEYLQKQNQILLEALLESKSLTRNTKDIAVDGEMTSEELSEYDEIYGI